MANGPQHYRQAEKAIEQFTIQMARSTARAATVRSAEVARAIVDGPGVLLELAQVHATLALAAASAQNIRRNGAVDVNACGDWTEVLG